MKNQSAAELDAIEMKPTEKSPSVPPALDAAVGVELSRHVATHHIRDAQTVLLDLLHELPAMKQRTDLTNFIGLLQVAERRLQQLDLGS